MPSSKHLRKAPRACTSTRQEKLDNFLPKLICGRQSQGYVVDVRKEDEVEAAMKKLPKIWWHRYLGSECRLQRDSFVKMRPMKIGAMCLTSMYLAYSMQ